MSAVLLIALGVRITPYKGASTDYVPAPFRSPTAAQGGTEGVLGWLLPLVLCSALLFFVPNAAAHSQLVSALFFVSAGCAGWPWLRYDAPYSFWMVAVGLWFCTGLVFPIIAWLVAELWK